MSQAEQQPNQAPPPTVEKPRKRRKKRPPHKSKMITGYIIYASEIRKEVIKKYPDRDFGDISKLVGIEWKNLPQETKVAYEKRAQEQNAKSKAITAEAFELKKLADAAESVRAKEQQQLQLNSSQHQTNNNMVPTTAMTVQYCNNVNNTTQNGISPAPIHQTQMQTNHQASTPANSQAQFQKNIIYRTPTTTVRQKPKDAAAQSEPIKWITNPPRDPPKFSQKFIDYLSEHKSMIIAQLSSD